MKRHDEISAAGADASTRRGRGRPARYSDPRDLWSDFIRFCEWTADNPIEARVSVRETSARDGRRTVTSTRYYNRPLTLSRFCIFAGIPEWRNFRRRYCGKADFVPVIRGIENAVTADQITGAMLRIYNGNIVSRLLSRDNLTDDL